MFEQITLQTNKLYSIYTAMDKTFVLDCSLHDDPNKKFNACLWRYNGDQNQKFVINKLSNGFYEVIETKNNLLMQVSNSKINNGAKIVFAPRKGQPNQWWQLIPASKTHQQYKGVDAYFFRSFCGKTIDIKHAKAINDAEIFQYDYNGNSNQIWVFV